MATSFDQLVEQLLYDIALTGEVGECENNKSRVRAPMQRVFDLHEHADFVKGSVLMSCLKP